MMTSNLLLPALTLLFVSDKTIEGQVVDGIFGRRAILERNLPVENGYISIGLELHNSLREDHDSPPLKLDDELQFEAQKTAESIVTSEHFDGLTFGIGRSPTGFLMQKKYSQNVFNITDEWLANRPRFATLYAISFWYDPVIDYDFANPTPSSFTRLIWKASTNFGIGLARCGNNTVVVANYSPPSEEILTPENLPLFQKNVGQDRTLSLVKTRPVVQKDFRTKK